jgi:hypothetical protein
VGHPFNITIIITTMSKDTQDLRDLLVKLSEEKGKWHIEKNIPISLILAIAVQTCAAVWWIAKTESRIDNIEQVASQPNVALNNLEERVTRIESTLDKIVLN